MMKRAKLTLLIAGLAVPACIQEHPKPPPKPAPPAPIDVDVVANCQNCHQAVFAEWAQSAHALAHPSKDPIFAAVRTARIEKEGEQVANACAGCHTPRAANKPDAPFAEHGVTCAGCHAVAKIKPGAKGAAAFEWAKGRVLYGPHQPGDEGAKVHEGGQVPPHMRDGNTLCLACHGELKGKQGVPVCTTGPEWAEVEGGKTCVDCHMPMVEGASGSLTTLDKHRSHRFWGPRSAWNEAKLDFVASGVKLSGAFDEGKLNVELSNTSQHAMPSGFPGRVVVVLAVGFDAEGKEVWKADPVLLNKVYVDAEGKPVLPPYATKLAKDSRLKPNETRKMSFDVPKTVKKAQVRIAYRLLPPPLAKMLKLDGAPLAGVKPVTKIEIPRG